MADPRAKFLVTAGTEFAKANRETKTFFSSVERSARVAMRITATAAAGASAGLLVLAENAARSADALAKQADKLGIATEKLAAMQLAGRLTGVENEKLTLGLQRMTRRIAEAAQGTGEAQGALRELGLDAKQLAGLTLDQQFQRIAERMADVDGQAHKIRLAFKLFDSEGVDLVRTLDVMGDGFSQIEDEARRFGVALSRVDARKLEQANDAVERAQTAWQGIGTRIALAIAPIKENLANSFADAAAEAEGFQAQIDFAMRALVVGVNFAANSIRGIAIAFKFAQLAMLELQRLKAPLEDAARSELEFQLRLQKEFLDKLSENDPARHEVEGRVKALQNRLATMGTQSLEDIIAKQDELGQQIDLMVGKIRTAEEALAAYDAAVAAAEARAREAVEPPPELRPIDLEALQVRQEILREALIEHQKKTQQELLKLERQAARERERINAQAEQAIRAQRQQTQDLAVGLLQALGAKNKAFAIAAIVLEKALAIQRMLLANRVAAELAFASQLIPGDPTSFARAAAAKAAVLAQGKISAALIAATGLVQIATLGEGSTGAPLGTPTNPVFTESAGEGEQGRREERVVTINLYGDVLTEDRLERVLTNMFDSDRVVIRSNTAQAAVMRRET